MNTEQIAERVKNKATIWALVEPDVIKMEDRFIDDLGFDSLDQIEMVMEMESEFDIEIADEDAEKVQTVADAVALIQRIVTPNV